MIAEQPQTGADATLCLTAPIVLYDLLLRSAGMPTPYRS
jgi:hypothetical protein